MCRSFAISSAAEYPRSLRGTSLTLVYLYSSSCDTPLHANRYRTCSITQWHINVEEYQSLIKSSTSTGNLISLVFYSWEMLRRALKTHPPASSTLSYFFWHELFTGLQWKRVRKECLSQCILHYSEQLHNLFQNTDLQCTGLRAASRITCTLFSSAVIVHRVVPSLSRPSVLN